MRRLAKRVVLVGAAVLAVATALAGCRGCSEPSPAASDPLTPHRGKVLVLLMGMPGCQGTEAATGFLAGYVKTAPADVAVLRVDVPPPGAQLAEPGGAVPIARETDPERKLAGRLEFFYYPTLYLLDRDGEVRFAGGCDPDRVKEMVAALCAEKPGAAKTSFSPPLLPIGQPAPAFTGRNPAGEKLGLEGLRGAKGTLLFFGATSCPFSNEALGELAGLAKTCGERGVGVAVVTRSPADEQTGKLHQNKAPGIRVVCDPEDTIGRGQYSVPAVPFFFLLDGQGLIAARGPFTGAAAATAMDKLLGVQPGCASTPDSTGAG